MKLLHTQGEWKVRTTVDDSGDYPFPTYDIISIFPWGPQGLGTADQNPYNAKLFAGSSRLLKIVIDKLMCNGCLPYLNNGCEESCREYTNKLLVEEITGFTIRELLSNDK
jgi:hypothetical protein